MVQRTGLGAKAGGQYIRKFIKPMRFNQANKLHYQTQAENHYFCIYQVESKNNFKFEALQDKDYELHIQEWRQAKLIIDDI
ncbi:hypothetical protein EV44_g3327 [Erysiphe necator]|uniref:Uncharacterized protein n=1 Tax=Uncinula necator TaxID=52586 RepID=A0A0B1P0R1_UNCNE|nr:hypothetical protein EV44_g3327 [Erysiphe necator]